MALTDSQGQSFSSTSVLILAPPTGDARCHIRGFGVATSVLHLPAPLDENTSPVNFCSNPGTAHRRRTLSHKEVRRGDFCSTSPRTP